MIAVSLSPAASSSWTVYVEDDAQTPFFGSATVIRSAFVANNGASDRWWMVFNTASVPANGTVPVFAVRVAAGEQLRIPMDYRFATGVTWQVSSTSATLTADTAATFGVKLEYIS
jgi:hypothetical protein